MKTNKYVLIVLIAAQSFFISCKNNSSEEVSESKVTAATEAVADTAPAEETSEPIAVPQEERYTDDDEMGSNVGVCFEKSDYTLPYNKTINPATAKYKILPCEVEGVDEYLCESRGLRYISLPKYKDVDVVLVPMDCGDFSYRYFLLTVKDKKVAATQYVEGEWYEPGDESYKEISKFSIDNNYRISVTTNSVENGKSKLKEKLDFQLLPDGKLKKI